MHDIMVIGGGVMGCTTALRLAQGGLKVLLIEREGLCMQASGVNAGTLSVGIKRASLIQYAIRGSNLWRTTPEWAGFDAGFHQIGGLTLAFNDEEAEMLTERMDARKANGAPIEMVGLNRAKEIEPGISNKAVLAAYCPIDGYANSNEIGSGFRGALKRAGVEIKEFTRVDGVEREDQGYAARTPAGIFRGKRVVIAGGVWLEELLKRDFGINIPITCRTNMVSVTERLPPVMRNVLGIATSLLTLKQSTNGTVLIGGGWQGKGDTKRGGYEIVPENLLSNLRLACYVIPELRKARIARTWLGIEGNTQDVMPIVGDIPGSPGAFVIGAVRGGFTIGPCMGMLLAQYILGKEPELPLFDPTRVIVPDDTIERVAS